MLSDLHSIAGPQCAWLYLLCVCVEEGGVSWLSCFHHPSKNIPAYKWSGTNFSTDLPVRFLFLTIQASCCIDEET